MRRPPGALGGNATRVLAAVLAQQFPTVPGTCQIAGLARSTTHKYLVRLKEAGLVDWEPEQQGSLRAKCSVRQL
jgi:DNA-binding IclR family transcriptional regulator